MRDLSLITDTLRQIIKNAVDTDPLWGGAPPPFSFDVTGQHPQQPLQQTDCELNLYLFHVTSDKFQANAFWTQQAQSGGPGGNQPVAFEPLCLDLWYMLSAQSKSSYTQEQQLLGIGMRALHEHATVRIAAPTPPPDPVTPSEVSVVLESPTFDELSRLWQALGLPLRTTAQYRVSVVFLTALDLPAPQPNVLTMTVAAAPGDSAADPALPRLLGTTRTVTYVDPANEVRSAVQSPATTTPAPAGVAGQEVVVDVRGMAETDRVLLVAFDVDPAGVETDVTATWTVPLTRPYPAPPASGVPLLIRPPAGAGAPAPGRYQLRIARPSVPGWRSAAVPLDVAAWVEPAPGALLTPAAGVYTMNVRNVPGTGAELRLGTVPLTRVSGGIPAAGEWILNGTALTFAAPSLLPAGRYPVRLRVADIESDAANWAVV